MQLSRFVNVVLLIALLMCGIAILPGCSGNGAAEDSEAWLKEADELERSGEGRRDAARRIWLYESALEANADTTLDDAHRVALVQKLKACRRQYFNDVIIGGGAEDETDDGASLREESWEMRYKRLVDEFERLKTENAMLRRSYSQLDEDLHKLREKQRREAMKKQ